MSTKYGDISRTTAGAWSAKLLERGQAIMVLERVMTIDPQGQNKGKSRTFTRYNPIQPAVAPLAEGVTPAGQKVTITRVTANLEQYGDWVGLTDVVADTHEDPVLNEQTEVVGEAAAETKELLRFMAARGGSNVFYAGGPSITSRATVNSPPLLGDLRLVYRAFARARARKFTTLLAPSVMTATQPVGPSYWAFGHTDLKADICSIPGFVPVENYSQMKGIEGEIGHAEGFRFVLTDLFSPWLAAGLSGSTYLTNGSSGTGQADVYPLLFFAKNGFAGVPLSGKNAITPIVVNPNHPSHSDKLGQQGHVGYKFYDANVILQQLWVARLECAVRANPTT